MKSRLALIFLSMAFASLIFPSAAMAMRFYKSCEADGFLYNHIVRDNGTEWIARTDATCDPATWVAPFEVLEVLFGEQTQGPLFATDLLRSLERDAGSMGTPIAVENPRIPEWSPPQIWTLHLNPNDVGPNLGAFLTATYPQWRDLSEQPAPEGSQVPAQCIAPPPGIAFWARFNGALGPDEIRGQTVRGTTNAARQLVDTDIPGHSGQFLRRGGANSQVWFDSPPGVPASPQFLGLSDFSVEFWVRIDPAEMARSSYGTATILDTRTTRQQESRGISVFAGNSIQVGNGYLRLLMAEDANTERYHTWGSDAVIADGRWHHVAISVDRNSTAGGRLAVDGQIVNIVLIDPGTNLPYLLDNPQSSFDPTPVSGRLGQAHNVGFGLDRVREAAETPFDLDEVAFYNRALTTEEMHALAQMPKCP